MTSTRATQPPTTTSADRMGVVAAACDGEKTAELLDNSLKMVGRGSAAINGVIDVDVADATVSLLMGLGFGMALLLARVDHEESERKAAIELAKTDPLVMAKAKRMVNTFNAGMKDAERTIRAGQTVQLELDLTGIELDW